MRCLCCGKELTGVSDKEISWRWHKKCVKNFFGINELPTLNLTEEVLRELAAKNSRAGYTVPGVQKKLSLHLTKEDGGRLTLVGYPSGYILKPQTEEYAMLPENEYMVMSMAKFAGIKTVPFALIAMESGELAYITKRVDRVGEKKLAMEDFCQLDLRVTEDKYKGSYNRCSDVIKKYSCQKLFDLTELFIRVVFSFLVGNSDMHLKNLSLISENGKDYRLSEAYDMLSVKIVMDDKEELALALNGKTRNLKRGDFVKFGESVGLQKEACRKLIDRLTGQIPQLINICNQSLLSDDLKKKWVLSVEERGQRLSGM